MDIRPINKQSEEVSQKKLQDFYKDEMISAEKKSYLTLHDKSMGPYLAVESEGQEPVYLLDAASQIATLGLGFNSSVFMGTAHHSTSWTNRQDTKEFRKIREAMTRLMARKTGWEQTYLTVCNSGAESNETALGFCYRRRVNPKANKILAFEGSFHGRMLISLASTWNKSKREPFQFPEFETLYSPSASIKGAEIRQELPKNWTKSWDNSVAKEFKVEESWKDDEQIAIEINSLLDVRQKLLTGEIFAIIIEPMQCEGGDNYSSNRFHSALISMANSFQVPIIYDEVQTGFHLGRDFFWHVDLQITDDNGNVLYPDYVTCAKKAQVGLVLSRQPEVHQEQFHTASFLRGYLHAMSLDQSSSKIVELEQKSHQKLLALVDKYSEHVEQPRSRGMSFALDVKNTDLVSKIINLRFEHGLLYYPAGSNTLRFRLNLGFSDKDLNFLYEQLDAIFDRVFNSATRELPSKIDTNDRDIDDLYFWQSQLIRSKSEQQKKPQDVLKQLDSYFQEKHKCQLVVISDKNFDQFKEKIVKLEKNTYEPARQTAIEKFALTASSKVSSCLALTHGDDLVAIVFASSLGDHPYERGTRRDDHFNDPNALYMLDTTVAENFHSLGLGKKLKYAMTLYARSIGATSISGRNRDHMAAQMLNINLSLGAVETQYLIEDYPDNMPYRDVIYYEIPTRWEEATLNLSAAIDSPLEASDLDAEFMVGELSTLNNKICLSNFVNVSFLERVKTLFHRQPEQLRHGYTASGQSECVDKIAKSIWFKGEKKSHSMLTFSGQYFGSGSFLSRSLSEPEDQYLPTTYLDNPHEVGESASLQQLESELKADKYLALWMEPMEQKTMKKLSLEYLKKVRNLCDQYKVPLVYNETASSCYRYSSSHFFCSNIEGATPDASMTFLGGQIGIVNLITEHFVAQPLMMISTWDGDEFSLVKYLKAVEIIEKNKDQYDKDVATFEQKLQNLLSKYDLEEFNLRGGNGSFKGRIPQSLAKYFKHDGERYLVCPSYGHIKTFNTLGGEL